MKVQSGKRSASSSSVVAKEPAALRIPIREIDDIESLALGFRQEMLEMGDGMGDVSTGAGLGTDFIILKWGDRQAVVRGSELLRAWVETFAPEDAERFPDSVRLLPEHE